MLIFRFNLTKVLIKLVSQTNDSTSQLFSTVKIFMKKVNLVTVSASFTMSVWIAPNRTTEICIGYTVD